MIIDSVKKRKSGTITINYTEGGKQYGLTLTPHEIVENYLNRPTKRAADVCPAADNGKHSWHPDKDNYLIYHCIKCGARG